MRQEQDNYIVESKNDFIGWEILYMEDWKPGVKRVWIRKLSEAQNVAMIVYADEEYTKDLVADASSR